MTTPRSSPDTAHYLTAIRRRLEMLYDASADNPRLREHLSDEVDWIDVQIEQSAAPTAWRWRAPGATVWIYDPEPAWREAHKDEIELEALYAAPSIPGPAQAPAEQPLKFFSESVDAWGAAEWFNRLATAIRQQDAAVLAKDDATMEICRNVAASSAMRLVRDYEQQVRVALSVVSSRERRCGFCDGPLPCLTHSHIPSTERKAPASCTACFDEADCANVDICNAVEEVYPATSTTRGES